jgi:hypothetical protein
VEPVIVMDAASRSLKQWCDDEIIKLMGIFGSSDERAKSSVASAICALSDRADAQTLGELRGEAPHLSARTQSELSRITRQKYRFKIRQERRKEAHRAELRSRFRGFIQRYESMGGPTSPFANGCTRDRGGMQTVVDDREEVDRMMRCYHDASDLPQRYRDVIDLFLDGMDTPAIALKLGLSQSGVRYTMKAAVRRLRLRMSGRESVEEVSKAGCPRGM